ncbi:MAG: ABC transporter substrate-binding protein [Bacteroidetes bacterium]|nr:ABC transporter substrate-binding protein [Bacteroidota bacterium]
MGQNRNELRWSAPRFQPFLCLILACLLLACDQTAHQSKENRSVFRLNLSSGSLESLDPAYAKDLYTMWTTHMIYNTLVETDSDLKVVPSLATHWERSADGLRYRFHLRRDVFFQDAPQFKGGKGRQLVAADVVYSFRRLLKPEVASSGAWIFHGRIAADSAFVALDDSTFELRLQRPFAPMLPMLSMPYCSIVPQEVAAFWGKDFRRHPCGSGPFQLFAWDEGNTLILHRFPRYFEKDGQGRSLPYLDAVQVSFYDSKATEFMLFLQGRLDFVNGIDGSFKDLVLTRRGQLQPGFAEKYHLSRSTYLNTEYIGFLMDSNNALLRQAPTRFRLVRQAMNYAIDRRRIITYFRNGVGIPATGGFIPKGLPGHDADGRDGYSYNPKKAAALLRAAGFPNGKGLGVVTILTPDNWSDIVNFICTELADVGIRARTEVMQPNILRQQMSSSKAPVFRAQWIADYPDAETYLAFFNSRLPAPPNYTRFHDSCFDAWYDGAMTLPDSLRYQHYHKMDSLAMAYAPVMALFYDQLLHFTQKEVSGFRSNPMNLIELKAVRLGASAQ